MRHFKFLAATFALFGFSLAVNPVFASGPPPNPTVYSGAVQVDGTSPENSVFEVVNAMNKCIERCVFAKVGSYTSMASIIRDGKYALVVGPPDATFVGGDITFHYDDRQMSAAFDENTPMADEVDEFTTTASFQSKTGFDLTFNTEKVAMMPSNEDLVSTETSPPLKSPNFVNVDAAEEDQEDRRIEPTKAALTAITSEQKESSDVHAKEEGSGDEIDSQATQLVDEQSSGGGCMMSSGTDITLIIASILPPGIILFRRKIKS